MKFIYYGLVALSVAFVSVATATGVSADDQARYAEAGASQTSAEMSQTLVDVANDYVTYNVSLKKFVVSEDLAKTVTILDYTLVKNQVESTNDFISEEIKNGTQNFVVKDANNLSHFVQVDNFDSIMGVNLSAGRNDIQVHWNYVRIFIDKSNLNKYKNIGSGALGAAVGARGGVPGAVIGSVVGGVIAEFTHFDNGMWFDFNFAMRKVTAYGWQ